MLVLRTAGFGATFMVLYVAWQFGCQNDAYYYLQCGLIFPWQNCKNIDVFGACTQKTTVVCSILCNTQPKTRTQTNMWTCVCNVFSFPFKPHWFSNMKSWFQWTILAYNVGLGVFSPILVLQIPLKNKVFPNAFFPVTPLFLKPLVFGIA